MEHESSPSRITCQFLNESDTSLKSCTVQYGNYDETLAYISRGNSTVEAPNKIALNVDPGRLGCYVVTASSDTISILIEGRITMISAGKFFSAWSHCHIIIQHIIWHKNNASLNSNVLLRYGPKLV